MRQVSALVLSLGVLMGGALAQAEAEEPLDQSAWLTGDEAVSAPVDPAALEAAIQGLREPIAYEQVSQIFFDLTRLEDPQEQERLQRLLDEQMAQLAESPSSLTPAPVETPPDIPQASLDPALERQVLQLEITTLRLGPDASVEELRRRDEVFAKIARIPDPNLRYELLELLGAQERAVEQSAAVQLTEQGDSR